MKRCSGRGVVFAGLASAFAASACSLLVDTSGLTGQPAGALPDATDSAADATEPSDASSPDTDADSGCLTSAKRLYLLGGFDENGGSSTVSSAAIGCDGMPGEWRAEAALPQGTSGGVAAVVNGKIVVAAGTHDPPGNDGVAFVATVLDGGGLSWQMAAAPPDDLGLDRPATVNVNDVMLIIGGAKVEGGTAGLTSVLSLTVSSTVPSLAVGDAGVFPSGIYRGSAAASGDHVYLACGFDANGDYLTKTWRARSNNVGTTWESSMRPFPCREAGLAVVGSKLIAFGTDTDAMEAPAAKVATIQSDGSLGAWGTTKAMPTPLLHFAWTASGHAAWTVGGRSIPPDDASSIDASSSQSTTTVQVATLDDEVGIKRWATATPLPTTSSYAMLVAY